MGFAQGLRAWRRLLKPNGIIAVTEISWLTPNIPDEAKRFWSEGYPPMANVEDNLKTIASAGYTYVSHFVIPENAWWDEYYTPIEARIKELKSKYKDAPEAIGFLNDQQKEIDLYRKYSASYGYVFYIARNREKSEIRISPE